MTCRHDTGFDVKSDVLVDRHELSSGIDPSYVLDVTSIACRSCGRRFLAVPGVGFAVRIRPAPEQPRPVVERVAPIDVDDIENVA